jgi:hypothetical protein
VILKQVLKGYHKRAGMSNRAVFTHKKVAHRKEIKEPVSHL